MNKIICIICLIIAVLMLLLCFLHFFTSSQERIVKFEVYENSSEYLVVTHHKNNSISLTIETKPGYDYRAISCGANFIEDGRAVFDGKHAFPQMPSIYYEFLFYDKCVEWYNMGEYQSTYSLIVRKYIY